MHRSLRALVVLIALVPLGGCGEGILDPQGPIASAERQVLFNSLVIMLAIVIPTIVAILAVGFRLPLGLAVLAIADGNSSGVLSAHYHRTRRHQQCARTCVWYSDRHASGRRFSLDYGRSEREHDDVA